MRPRRRGQPEPEPAPEDPVDVDDLRRRLLALADAALERADRLIAGAEQTERRPTT